MLHAGLVLFAPDGTIVPGIARAWELSDDGRTYRFHFSEGMQSSDGAPLGAREAAASLRRLLSPATASPRAWVLERVRGAAAFRDGDGEGVEGIRVVEGNVLEVELEAPSASFLALLAMPSACILPAGAPVDGRVTTGPWVLREWVRDSRLVFARNPHWVGDPPAFERVRVRILPQEFTRTAEFEVGNLDLLEIPASDAGRFHGDDDRVVRQVALVTEYVGLNNEDPVLADPRIRRAINHAVNVDRILEQVVGGRGVRSSGAIPPTLPGGGSGRPFAYDLARARALIKEADLPLGWTLEIWQRPSPLAQQVLQAVQMDLLDAGIRAVIRLRDWSALKASIDRGDTQAFYINWYADYPDPENFLVPLFHSRNIGGGGNRARFRDPEIDALLDALQVPGEAGERATLAADLDRRIHEQAPWLYLWHPVLEVAVSDRIETYEPHAIPSCERWLGVRPRLTTDAPR